MADSPCGSHTLHMRFALMSAHKPDWEPANLCWPAGLLSLALWHSMVRLARALWQTWVTTWQTPGQTTL